MILETRDLTLSNPSKDVPTVEKEQVVGFENMRTYAHCRAASEVSSDAFLEDPRLIIIEDNYKR